MSIQWVFALLALLFGMADLAAVAASSAKASDSVITTTEVFGNLFGPGSLTYTETFTMSSVGLTPYGSHSPDSASSNTEHVSIETIWATNTSTASVTIPVTTTRIQPASTITITVSSVESKSTATGLCYWGQEAILTPCTDLVLATATASTTQKSAAISLSENNAFKPIVKLFKYIVSFGAVSQSTKKITARFEMYGESWDNDCLKVPMVYSPMVCSVVFVAGAGLLAFSWRNNTSRQNAICTALILLLIPIMSTATYLELYVRPYTRFSHWWEACRQPCAILSQNSTALCLQANATQPVSHAEPMPLQFD